MNATAWRLATSSRLEGAKSSASMLLEMSIAMTMAIPSCFTSTVSPPICGPGRGEHERRERSPPRSTGGIATHQRRALTAAGMVTSL